MSASTSDLITLLPPDLTSEIRGERLRFVEAMREATNINVHSQSGILQPSCFMLIWFLHTVHVQEFKKSLTQEIAQHSQELADMREQKKALELVISDLFAIKAKHANEPVMVSFPSTMGTARYLRLSNTHVRPSHARRLGRKQCCQHPSCRPLHTVTRLDLCRLRDINL